MTPTSNHDPAVLACRSCGNRNESGICGIKLMNPIGCDEVVIVVKCVGCGQFYLEEEEDGEAHRDGPDYRTSGPYEEAVAHELMNASRLVPSPGSGSANARRTSSWTISCTAISTAEWPRHGRELGRQNRRRTLTQRLV
jgi:hypothetical protein